MMKEIGIASFFGGSAVWLFDAGGLAQPGTLKGVKKHPLARLYPGSLLVSASEELEAVRPRTGCESRGNGYIDENRRSIAVLS